MTPEGGEYHGEGGGVRRSQPNLRCFSVLQFLFASALTFNKLSPSNTASPTIPSLISDTVA